MTRSTYICLFITSATFFVPIIIFFGVVEFIVPFGWGIAALVKAIFSAKFGQTLVLCLHVGLYLGIFYGAARLTFVYASSIRSDRFRVFILCASLIGLMACSFLRVITYSSIQGRGGTYTLWAAVARYFEIMAR